jgi:hypothetical protein
MGYFRKALAVRGNKPYTNSNYADVDVHDTHTHGDRSNTAIFPDDFPGDTGPMERALHGLLAKSYPIIETVCQPTDISRVGGFHLTGADVMFEGGRPYFIELNAGPTFPGTRDKNFSKEVYRAVWGWAIAPLLGRQPRATKNFAEILPPP